MTKKKIDNTTQAKSKKPSPVRRALDSATHTAKSKTKAAKSGQATAKNLATVVKAKITKPQSAVKTGNASKSASAWDAPTVLAKLQSMGSEKLREYNKKNGAGENQFGLKMGDIRTVANKIKTDHALALELWKTKNVDAQLLATLIIQPAELSAKELARMVRSVSYMWLADWLHSYVIKEHPAKESLRVEWMGSADKMEARAGWRLTAGRVAKQADGLELDELLDRIESEMATAPPEVQWTMNMCLAEIGIHHPKLRKRAIGIGERLGIYRDYPCSKGCTSPFAPIWINEIVKRQR
jgi:3-methyladenine DNA glycosylase AlkD